MRADAALNQQRILAAAEELFAGGDPRSITMEDIARAAGVGRATLYRRYPTPAAVAIALLDEHETKLQSELLKGKPPLGPGAAPEERLAAFYTASVRLLERHLPLALGAEAGSARYETGAYGFWRAHVRALLVAAEVDDPDPLVDVLLAPLTPEVFAYQRRERRLSADRITKALHHLAHRVLTPPGRTAKPPAQADPRRQELTG